ncbi:MULTISPECIES: HIT family protein [Nocardiopsis]|uniref:Histidine triad (HIT) protein n=1 Tax=Nocardiopsis dassonvillei (strain ATCC 23218 / DSM 43111 / CIP 107115 / JCM 7437 / KCTC 9190 / NBRC 14626 / NCTC 10488 / NRRL B-5397 / IMRU 509) TaxID=446468 RepID=D7AZH0_NOCDD|nr:MULTISPECIES: HIT domain-containing protein [Nocardiopsis]ADH66262.1 histidine triad (HIT) protein [Nocardiopsis dassonvillei subsp. dassonvillei DSM 43111]APC34586.1 HIT family hydrolase [Nocardiopsis dassonvillei]NKY81757.1 HIT domain-containing protein [Nocardiopsis dassonvillei]VEI92284.1 AP-4-A phosphorylase [Nocardiopsis dassonvillei]
MRGADDEHEDVPGDPPAVGTGSPDGWERLWTPHRMAYIKGEGKPSGSRPEDGCPFCRAPGLSDPEGLVVARGKSAYAVLNLYPYNSGHILICPYRHVSDYTALDEEETAEVAALTQAGILALGAAYGPQGFNVGMNLGGAAGAGIAAHLHQHIVPRWGGDANFMPVIGRTKVLPEMLEQTRSKLAAHWPRE